MPNSRGRFFATPLRDEKLSFVSSLSPEKLARWDQLHMMNSALRVGTTLSSLKCFIEPFHRLLIEKIALNHIPAYSLHGKVPEIFFQQRAEQESYGPLGAYLHLKDILEIAEEALLPQTSSTSAQYRGGDMYTPLLSSLEAAQDYTSDIGGDLLLFNTSALWEKTSTEQEEKDKASGPDIPVFNPPF